MESHECVALTWTGWCPEPGIVLRTSWARNWRVACCCKKPNCLSFQGAKQPAHPTRSWHISQIISDTRLFWPYLAINTLTSLWLLRAVCWPKSVQCQQCLTCSWNVQRHSRNIAHNRHNADCGITGITWNWQCRIQEAPKAPRGQDLRWSLHHSGRKVATGSWNNTCVPLCIASCVALCHCWLHQLFLFH